MGVYYGVRGAGCRMGGLLCRLFMWSPVSRTCRILWIDQWFEKIKQGMERVGAAKQEYINI